MLSARSVGGRPTVTVDVRSDEKEVQKQLPSAPDPSETKSLVDKKPEVPKSPKSPTPPWPHWSVPDWVRAGRPEGRLLRLVWRVYVLLRLYKVGWIPQPPEGSYKVRTERLKKSISRDRRLIQAIIAVFTVKGGAAKTTVTTWLAAVTKSIIKRSVLAVDLDFGGGKVAKRFGRNESETLTVQQFNYMLEAGWQPQGSDMPDLTESDDEAGVVILHAPPGNKLDHTQTAAVLRAAGVVSHIALADLAPGLQVPANDGAVQTSTVKLVTGRMPSGDDLDDIETTLNYLAYDLRSPENADMTIVVVSDVPRRSWNTRTQYELAERFEVRPDHLVLIPHDRYIAGTEPVNADKIEAVTLLALCTLVRAVADAAKRYNVRHALSEGGLTRRLPGEKELIAAGTPLPRAILAYAASQSVPPSPDAGERPEEGS